MQSASSYLHRFPVAALVFAVALAALSSTGDATEPVSAGGTATILAINDVYRLNGADDGASGGMPRVRALRKRLEQDAPDLLFLHAGDFLAPSFLGRLYKGEQMVDLMNVMDGSPTRGTIDERMFAAFGNHEFDDTHCTKQGPLGRLVEMSEFRWIASNLDFSRCEGLSHIAGAPNLISSRIVESGGLRIGLYGLTLARSKYADIVTDPQEVSCREVKALRAEGADAVVALTHLTWQTDLQLLGFGPDGRDLAPADMACAERPDIVIGGHDHINMALPSRGPRLFKADADAVSAWVVRLTKSADGGVSIDAGLVMLTGDSPRDPLAQRLADQWTLRHDERFCTADCIGREGDDLSSCRSLIANGACLAQRIARTNAPIETEELMNRSFETGFGDWVADEVRAAGGAEVAFLNAGGIRLNYNLPAGTMITRKHLEEMFPFANKLAVREVQGAVLWHAMTKALQARGEGAWGHVSGLAARFAVEDGEQELAELLVRRADGSLLEITPETQETVSLASVSFVLANGDGHGFDLCPEIDDVWACKDEIEDAPNWPLEGDGTDLSGFVRLKLLELGEDPGLDLATDGRLCDPTDSGCLIDAWRDGGKK